ncbi:MAG: DNA repair protein RecN [Selenomonadaceae bacterium]|nr:DNA repair protein RecN [Selenomonadaceae bacterium]
MLKNLSVQNFALIENAELEFGEGLNILTGETGAGKSILIDALGAVLGSRITSSQIRAGCENLRVEAVFFLSKNSAAHKILSELEIDDEEENLIITRKFSRAGKSFIVVNGSHVTLSTLKKIGATLVDIHGQNENLALLREESIYNLIDSTDEKISAVKTEYQKLFRSWSSQVRILEEKRQKKSDNEQKLDMLKWQEQEISQADLKIGEDEELENEIKKLSHAEKISENISAACNLLGDSDFDILTALAKVEKNLDEVLKFDDKLNSARKLLEDAEISLREVYDDVRNYADETEFSPELLDSLHARMDVIFKLKKKYGDSVEKILERLENIRTEIFEIENFDSDLETLQKLIEKLEGQTKKRAENLFKLRQNSAENLSAEIEKEIQRLGMEKAKFKIEVQTVEKFSANGSDKADMIFSANVGEEMQSLSKVVSGGELSRVALAIKTISAGREDSASTMVFDEIDTGLGGTTAKVVAECIAKVSRSKQVLCVTHLAQIACMADTHLHISKSDDDERTVTEIKILENTDRVKEISRMASGEETSASIKNAATMISSAQKIKNSIKIRK